MEKIYYTVEEVAAAIGVSAPRAYQLVAQHRIPATRLTSGRIRIPRLAFERWLEQQAEDALAGLIKEDGNATNGNK